MKKLPWKWFLNKHKKAIALSTTGITGDKPLDGIEPGTICIAWGLYYQGKIKLKSQTFKLTGTRKQLQLAVAKIAHEGLILFYNDVISS